MAALLVLTALTALVGGLAMFLTFRITGTFRYITEEYRPYLRDMSELAAYVDREIRLAHETELRRGTTSIEDVRRQLDRAFKDFEALYEHIVQTNVEHQEVLEMAERLHEDHDKFVGDVGRLLRSYATEIRLLEQTQTARIAFGRELERLYQALGRNGTTAFDPPTTALLELQWGLSELPLFPSQAGLAEIEAQVAEQMADLRQALGPGERVDALEASLLGSSGYLTRFSSYIDARVRTSSTEQTISADLSQLLQSVNAAVTVADIFRADSSTARLLAATPSIMVSVVLFALVLSVVLGIVLTGSVTAPVARLQAATHALAAGDYAHRVRVSSGDELEHLGEAFNEMAARLQELTTGLETQVVLRTEELRREVKTRRAAESSLRASEQQYRALIDTFPTGVIALVDPQGTVHAAGGSGIDLLSLRMGQNLAEAGSMRDPEGNELDLLDSVRPVFDGADVQFECDGRGRSWVVHAVPARNTVDLGSRATLLLVDVTDMRAAEREVEQKQQQLLQADKMAALGLLVAGVAHEISNPNQSVRMAATVLEAFWRDAVPLLAEAASRREETAAAEARREAVLAGIPLSEASEAFRAHVRSIRSASERINRIVQGLKDFARENGTPTRERLDINEPVRAAHLLLEGMVRKATDRFEVALGDRLPLIVGNAQRIEQVVVNLVQNACQALTERHQAIRVETRVDPDPPSVVLVVADEGAGIPEEALAKVQDPFFTTKRDRYGTGLGLSIVSGIVAEHGGTVSIASKPGAGTTVQCRFPANLDRQDGGMHGA
jgi:signal transduction histidine kinase